MIADNERIAAENAEASGETPAEAEIAEELADDDADSGEEE